MFGISPNAAGRAWSALALALLALVLLPILAVIWLALQPTQNIWPHLMATVLPRYLANTLILAALVGALTAMVGTGAAWLIAMYRFPGSRWLDYALLFPLAIPAYIGAYALVDFLNYSGPVQGMLRATMGWQSARDYWFPQTRSPIFAALVMAGAYYPYVYLLARAAFREQSGALYEVARALGAGPLGLFWRVGLPMARPSIAAGVALVVMETMADYGTVQHFGVQTLTLGVFSTWLDTGNAGGAAQISTVILGLVLALVLVERLMRRRARFHRPTRALRPIQPMRLGPRAGALATLLCLIPFLFGFVLPVAVMLAHAVEKPQAWLAPGLARALGNTLLTGGLAALLTVLAALIVVNRMWQWGRGLRRLVLPLATLGYAAPGAVLALGVLIPLAALDHRLANLWARLTGQDPGLILTGSAAALVLAYGVRFFGVAAGAVETAFGRVPPSLPMAARSLGQGAGGVLRRIYLPLMRNSVLTALLVVFVDCLKELPATLMLRPFNFNTLATRAYELASLEKVGESAPAALIIIAVGLAAVWVMARASAEAERAHRPAADTAATPLA